jgi:hypothetical protein
VCYEDINSPFKKEIFADDALKNRRVKSASESLEYLAGRGVLVRRQKRQDFDILSPVRRRGKVRELGGWDCFVSSIDSGATKNATIINITKSIETSTIVNPFFILKLSIF